MPNVKIHIFQILIFKKDFNYKLMEEAQEALKTLMKQNYFLIRISNYFSQISYQI